jgi:branched-chain amino acid transport system permease protein
MDLVIHQIFSGIATGGIYASLALALVMIHNSTNHINFAQGEMAMFATYLAWLMIDAGMPYWLAFVLTLAAGFLLGMAIERIFVRPFANAPALTVVIVFVGLLVILNSLAGWFFTYTVKAFPSPFPAHPPFGNKYISFHELGVTLITLAIMLVVFLFFRFTQLGLAMRAAAQNPVSSRLVGIRVGLMLTFGWGLASAIGAIGGMMVAPIVFLDPNMMSGVLLYAFAAALLGGINSPWGAVAGGFIIGIVENLAGTFLFGTELKLTVALIVIIGTLVIRPTGLFGTPIVTRV